MLNAPIIVVVGCPASLKMVGLSTRQQQSAARQCGLSTRQQQSAATNIELLIYGRRENERTAGKRPKGAETR